MANSRSPRLDFVFAPQQKEREKRLPEKLAIVEYEPSRKGFSGGAYNPYENDGRLSDTARMRRPRVDLRQLSEWIKTTQRVKALSEQDLRDAERSRK